MTRAARGPALALVALGGLAALHQWLDSRRPETPGAERSASELAVTSAADSGPGSLREAIFAANRSPERARIVVNAPLVELRHPLPPLANTRGTLLEVGPAGATLDASRITDAPGLDVDGPGTVIRGLAITGARHVALLIRAGDVELHDVTISESPVGILASADARGLVVRGCHLTANEVGIEVDPQAAPVLIEGCELRDHRDAGIWAIGPPDGLAGRAAITIRDNTFMGGRMGALLGHVPAEVVGNRLSAMETGFHLIGGGPRVRDNHLDDVAETGIFAERTTAATLIEENEIRTGAGIAILGREIRGTTVRGNRLYDNAYGIVDVLGDAESPMVIDDNLVSSQKIDGFVVVGGAPIIRRNVVARSRGAAVQSLDFIAVDGATTPARPRLDANRFEGNGTDGVVRGVYDARDEAADSDDGEPS